LSLGDRYATSTATRAGDQLAGVRSLGFYIEGVDMTTQPWTVTGASAAIDIVTSYGVANIDLQAMPIIGHVEDAVAGNQPVHVTVLDIGNTNTHCGPLPAGCTNVFDVQVDAQPGSGTARVLEYH
jgi:hypothetical protein